MKLSWKDHATLLLAQQLAWCRPLEPYPGWYFGVAEKYPTLLLKLRLAIWRYFNRKQLEKPIISPWYNALKVFLYLGNDSSRLIFVGGCYEPNEFFFLSKVMKRGMTFIDVGANEGLYSLFASTLVSNEGKVIAIEPSASALKRLKENIVLNHLQNITILPYAAFSHSGESNFTIAEYGHEGLNALGSQIANPLVRAKKVENIQMKTLNEMLNYAGVEHVDFIKVDAEGSELHVLEGAESIIQGQKPLLQLEINEPALRAQKSSPEDLMRLLESWGYHFYKFDESGKLVPERSSLGTDANVIAAPADHPFFY